MNSVWIWQRNVSPHTAPLASALARIVPDVRFVAEKGIQDVRMAMGWQLPDFGNAELIVCQNPQEIRELARSANKNCQHIFQGIRGNGSLALAQEELSKRKIQYWPLLETIEGHGIQSFAKQRLYRHVLRRKESHIRGILAIGANTPSWLKRAGFSASKIHPFTYFLADEERAETLQAVDGSTYRVLFVGRLIEQKNVDILIRAYARIALGRERVSLTIVGNGPSEVVLRNLSQKLGVSEGVEFVEPVSITKIPGIMRRHDLLVLPSRHDGWGAVVSEALMAGTPAIVSEACGAAEAVRACGVGAVVPVHNIDALASALQSMAGQGAYSLARRAALANWARAFGATAGAQYFVQLHEAVAQDRPTPLPPWRQSAPAFSVLDSTNAVDAE